MQKQKTKKRLAKTNKKRQEKAIKNKSSRQNRLIIKMVKPKKNIFNKKEFHKNMEELLGITGLVLILIAWLPGIIETLKSGKPGMKLSFMIIYFLGSLSLSLYALQLNSKPFFILNFLAALVPIIHFYFFIKQK